MILVLGGTLEGRQIARILAAKNYSVLVSVASDYGAGVMAEEFPAGVLVGRLDGAALEKLLRDRGIRMIVDATHPYARNITELARKTANSTGVPYIRYERPPAAETDDENTLYRVKTYEEAAELALSLGETVFLTIGSKNIGSFLRAGRETGKRVIARVLPDQKVLEECEAMGMAPRDIVALQGPVGFDMNLAMLKEYRADVLVTKDSGAVGGTGAKLEAAAVLGIPVVLIERPAYEGIPVTDSIEDVIKYTERIINHG